MGRIETNRTKKDSIKTMKDEDGGLEAVMLVEGMTSRSSGRCTNKVLSSRGGIMPLITERNCWNTKVTQSSWSLPRSGVLQWGSCYTNIIFLKLIRHDFSIHYLNINNRLPAK